MSPPGFVLVAIIASIFLSSAIAAGGSETGKKKPPVTRSANKPKLTAAQKKLLQTRAMLIERTKASRDGLKDLLEGYEEKLDSQSAEHAMNEIMYELDLLAKPKLDESRRGLVNTEADIQQVRRWIAEDEMALSLAGRDADKDRFPGLPTGKYRWTRAFIHYEGLADWSLADAGKVASFFLNQFGRPLPVSAMGQSSTHDRMGLDHREAMDVAIRPDSKEGLQLMAYLRKAGIPFIAFRNKMRGLATGAHIHIGRPSARLQEVKSPTPSVTIEKASHQEG